MTMQVMMKVAGMSTQPLQVKVIHAGEETMATVQSLEVELTSPDGHGSLVLRFTKQSEIDEAHTIFMQDGLVAMCMTGPVPELVDG